jgi:hypothetical protein
LREESTYSHHFGIPPPFLSFPEPDFQQFNTSSQPRGYYQKKQLLDTAKHFPKECLRNNHLASASRFE